MEQSRYNNFDVVRIVAALQVALAHMIIHFHLPQGIFYRTLTRLPGVPIFFVVSGYLVSTSLNRSPTLESYFRSRALRIYPALWGCLGISIALAAATGASFNSSAVVPWLLAQLTFVQFYNPDFLRGYGIGVLNGSLWTIPVELQFYVLLPLLRPILKGRALAFLIVGFVVVNRLVTALPQGALATKLVDVTALPYLYQFLIGVWLQHNPGLVERYLKGRALIWLVIYASTSFAFEHMGFEVRDNNLTPICSIVLGLTAISCAYTAPQLHRILRGNDLSYGLYIYHMPIVNAAIVLGLSGYMAVAALPIALMFAFASWKLIEKPTLGLKYKTQLGAATT